MEYTDFKLTGIILHDKGGSYTGYFKEFPGAVAQEDTIEACKLSMLNALIFFLTLPKDGREVLDM